MQKVVIFGTSLIAELAYFYFTNDKVYDVIAFTNPSEYIKDNTFFGKPVIPFSDIQLIYPPNDYKMFVSVGFLKRNKIRTQRCEEARQKGYSLVSYISPKATYYGTPIGDNCFIFENNVIQPFTEIGNNVFMWSGNHFGHHSKIKDNCFVASHVVISGNCTIEENCFIGVNATLADGVTIGAFSVIGAGAVVTKSIPENSLVVPEKSKILELKRDII